MDTAVSTDGLATVEEADDAVVDADTKDDLRARQCVLVLTADGGTTAWVLSLSVLSSAKEKVGDERRFCVMPPPLRGRKPPPPRPNLRSVTREVLLLLFLSLFGSGGLAERVAKGRRLPLLVGTVAWDATELASSDGVVASRLLCREDRLGTNSTSSFCSFCKRVKLLGLNCRSPKRDDMMGSIVEQAS